METRPISPAARTTNLSRRPARACSSAPCRDAGPAPSSTVQRVPRRVRQSPGRIGRPPLPTRAIGSPGRGPPSRRTRGSAPAAPAEDAAGKPDHPRHHTPPLLGGAPARRCHHLPLDRPGWRTARQRHRHRYRPRGRSGTDRGSRPRLSACAPYPGPGSLERSGARHFHAGLTGSWSERARRCLRSVC